MVGDTREGREILVEALHQSLIKYDLQNFAILCTSIANSSFEFKEFLGFAEPIAIGLVEQNEPSARELTNILSCFARHEATSSDLVKAIFK